MGTPSLGLLRTLSTVGRWGDSDETNDLAHPLLSVLDQ